MDLTNWRKQIDELDQKLVALLNERAAAAVEIGRLKRNTSLPIYEPDRERAVIANVQQSNRGPLKARDLAQIYERIMDVMRSIQRHEIVPDAESGMVVQPDLPSDSLPSSQPKRQGVVHERRKR
jgi:chorismate mutase-like protein